jgi:hypothetical protein
MEREEETKVRLFNTIHMNDTPKKKYFRIEKNKSSSLKENKAKRIFKTKKEYNLLKRKTLRDLENEKSIKNNKFITTTIDETTASLQSDTSFLVQNIIPKKLKIIKENKKEVNNMNYYFQKANDNILFYKRDNFLLNFLDNKNNENAANNIIINDTNINNYKIKLMLVYFYSIKNLCKYINNNFFNMPANDNKIIDEFLHQVYQDLQILNRKINEFKNFQKMNDNIKVNKEEFKDIYSLKENLLLMKIALNNSMSKNLINIYVNIDDFCRLFSFI